jgi:mannosyltransferase OCH1-like enzyme
MWELLDDVPDETLSFWERVNYLAVAAKVTKDANVTVDEAFQQRMDERLSVAAKERVESTNPVTLRKRIRQLERELQQERTKRPKLDRMLRAEDVSDTTSESTCWTVSDSPPHQALTELVHRLKADRKRDDFPSACSP